MDERRHPPTQLNQMLLEVVTGCGRHKYTISHIRVTAVPAGIARAGAPEALAGRSVATICN